jgi:hypothetical protein
MSKKDEEKLKNIESMIESIFAENKRLKEELNELKTELDKALYSNNALITKNKKLKEALKFYAEEKNIVDWRDYIVFKDEIQCNYRQINENDYLENGTTAQKTLEELL